MLGYDIAARILLNVSDWSQSTMRAAGQWEKGKAPKFQPEYRPWAEAQKRAEKKKAHSEGVDIHVLYGLLSAKSAQQMGR